MPSLCLAQVKNGDFSDPQVTDSKGYQMMKDVKYWTTTDREKVFEVWKDGTKDPAHNNRVFNAPPGIKQFVEVAAYSHGKLSQQVTGIKDGSQYGFSFWHRGRHSGDTEEDTIEVSVKDGNNPVWTKRFFTTAKEWKQYIVPVGKKIGTGPVTLSFESKDTASGNEAVGNFLTGIKLDETVKPPACVLNAGGTYDWTTDSRGIPGTDGKLTKLGPAKLNVADQKVSGTGRTGVWQVTADCNVIIDWQPGNFRDVLKVSDDGKTVSGTNQFGTKVQGLRK